MTLDRRELVKIRWKWRSVFGMGNEKHTLKSPFRREGQRELSPVLTSAVNTLLCFAQPELCEGLGMAFLNLRKDGESWIAALEMCKGLLVLKGAHKQMCVWERQRSELCRGPGHEEDGKFGSEVVRKNWVYCRGWLSRNLYYSCSHK